MINFLYKKKLLLITLFISSVFFSSCEENSGATTVIQEDTSSFKELKAKVDTKYILTTSDGKEIIIDLKDDKLVSKYLEGKTVLLNFWATWCPPCIEEMPMFNKVYEEYKDSFVILGILYERNKDEKELADFMKKHEIKFPVTVSAENFRLAKNIGNVARIPESFLYDRNGNFVKKYIGVVDEDELKSQLNKK